MADDHTDLFDGTNVPVISVYRGADLSNTAGDRRTGTFLGNAAEAEPQWRQAISAVQAIEPGGHCGFFQTYPADTGYQRGYV